MPSVDRAALIERYAAGPAELSAALAEVPAAARTWRPNPGCWSAHEVVLHCADSETNAHMRIRYLVAESAPAILGYDQDRWAVTLDYHHLPLEPALATVVAVRANTIPLLRRLSQPTGRAPDATPNRDPTAPIPGSGSTRSISTSTPGRSAVAWRHGSGADPQRRNESNWRRPASSPHCTTRSNGTAPCTG